jgi:hypothetical protein
MIARLKQTDPVQRLGMGMLILSGAIALVGTVNQYGRLDPIRAVEGIFRDFYSNVSTELGSIAITILIIDAMYRRRERETTTRTEKKRLIRQIGNRDPELTLRAVEELRLNGWLEDGSLEQVSIAWANLAGAHLQKADLSGAHLWLTNLKGARLYQADLKGAFMQAVNLQDANLDGATLAGANLNESNLLNASVAKTIFDTNTILPDCTYWSPGAEMRRFTDPLHPDFWRSKNPRSPAYHRDNED